MRRAPWAAVLLLAAAPVRAEVLLSFERGHETLDGDRPAWRSSALAAHWSTARGGVRGEWREVSRFGVADREARLAGTAHQDGLTLTVEFTASPDHELLPEFSGGFELNVPVGAGFVANAGGRRSAYDEDDATVLRGGIEYYVGAARAAYTAVNGRLESGDSGTAHVIQADWYYGDGNRLGAIAAAGGEATRIDRDTVVVADVISLALVGRHWLHGPWGLSYALTWTEQGDFYTRAGGVLGLLYRL
jgi:YaiO family outer membrane protein